MSEAGRPGPDGDAASARRPGPAVRRPASVYGVGTEPDPRFSLANERTALAWLRTGLALVAGGIALTSLVALADLGPALDVVAAATCLLGGAVAVSALRGWRAAERALRLAQPLPAPRMLPVLVGAVVVLAAVLAGFALAQAL